MHRRKIISEEEIRTSQWNVVKKSEGNGRAIYLLQNAKVPELTGEFRFYDDEKKAIYEEYLIKMR